MNETSPSQKKQRQSKALADWRSDSFEWNWNCCRHPITFICSNIARDWAWQVSKVANRKAFMKQR
jgi:hypothetical protein